jgi:hypothetical protein
MLSDLARFNTAKRYRTPLLIGGAIFAGLGAALVAGVWAQANGRRVAALPVAPAWGISGRRSWSLQQALSQPAY